MEVRETVEMDDLRKQMFSFNPSSEISAVFTALRCRISHVSQAGETKTVSLVIDELSDKRFVS